MSENELLETIQHELTDALGIQERPVEKLSRAGNDPFPSTMLVTTQEWHGLRRC